MRDGSPVEPKPYLSVAALPAAGGVVEIQPMRASVPPGTPEKLPVVHGSIPAHICAIIKGTIPWRTPRAGRLSFSKGPSRFSTERSPPPPRSLGTWTAKPMLVQSEVRTRQGTVVSDRRAPRAQYGTSNRSSRRREARLPAALSADRRQGGDERPHAPQLQSRPIRDGLDHESAGGRCRAGRADRPRYVGGLSRPGMRPRRRSPPARASPQARCSRR